MVTWRKSRSAKAEEPRNSAVILAVKDDETAISRNEEEKGSGSPEGVDVTVRRSARTRKGPVKYKSPSNSPISSKRSGSSKTSLSSPSDLPESSRSETDSDEVKTKKRKKRAVQVRQKGNAKATKVGRKKQTGPKMTEYEKMIQKNIEERNAFLAKLMKAEEDSSFEEKKPVRTSKKKREESSTNDDEEVIQQPKRRKVASRKRKVSSNEDDEKGVGPGYNTRSRGTKRPRGIYKEHDSSRGENDTLSDAADASDNDAEKTSGKRATRSAKRQRTAVIPGSEARAEENPENIEEESAVLNDPAGEGDKKDEDCVQESSSTEEATFVDTEEPKESSDEVVTPEMVTPEVVTPEVVTPEVVTPEVVTPETKIGIEGEGETPVEGRAQPVDDDNRSQTPASTPEDGEKHCTPLVENNIIIAGEEGKVDGEEERKQKSGEETEDMTSKKRIVRSEELVEEDKENSIPGETQDILSPGNSS